MNFDYKWGKIVTALYSFNVLFHKHFMSSSSKLKTKYKKMCYTKKGWSSQLSYHVMCKTVTWLDQLVKLAHWGWHKMVTIFQTFPYVFSWKKIYELWLRYNWSLFLKVQLAIFQHWFTQWLGASQATSHCLNQWWLVCWHICVTWPQWVKRNRVFTRFLLWVHHPLWDGSLPGLFCF